MSAANPGILLVVCTGNVCRSPYIERRLRQELAGTGVDVSSAGTAALVGRDMDPGTRLRLGAVGGPVDGFEARLLTPELVGAADLVVTAAREHRAAAARLRPAALARIFTLRDLADLLDGLTVADVLAVGSDGSWVRKVAAAAALRRGLVPARQEGVDVTDPIGRPPREFERMAAEVEAALRPVVALVRGGLVSAP